MNKLVFDSAEVSKKEFYERQKLKEIMRQVKFLLVILWMIVLFHYVYCYHK